MEPVIIICVIVVVLFAAIMAILSRYRKCPSDKVLVIYGKVGTDKNGQARSARCIHGGAAFIVPIIQSYEYYKAVIEYDADDEFSDEICALKAKACLMVAREYSGSDSATDLQKAIDLAKQASELSNVKLTGTKSVKGKFVRFGRAEGKKFDTAFYKVSDSEYPNVFPCEVVMRSKIYIPDKVCRLRYDGKRNEVFDLNAVCCVIFGLVLSSVSAVMMILFLLTVIGVN